MSRLATVAQRRAQLLQDIARGRDEMAGAAQVLGDWGRSLAWGWMAARVVRLVRKPWSLRTWAAAAASAAALFISAKRR